MSAMKFKYSRTNIRIAKSNRGGVTIVEVLTSIIVAVIGVAGVLVMIPFGVRQAQTGLDLQDTTTLAENADQEFRIRGYGLIELGDTLPWVTISRSGRDLVPLQTDPGDEPFELAGWYLIDPLWMSSLNNQSYNDNDPTTVNQIDMFRFVGGGDSDLFFDGDTSAGTPAAFPFYTTLRDRSDSGARPISLGFADRIFRSRDDLQFASERNPENNDLEIDERDPPIPFLDKMIDPDTGIEIPLRRQFEGDISWAAVAVPRRRAGDINLVSGADGRGLRIEGFDFHVMVFNDRTFSPNAFTPDQDPRFIVSSVDPILSPTQIFETATLTLNVAPGAIDIQNDEWVMLINFDGNRQSHVGFYRVIGSVPDRGQISIVGDDFTIDPLDRSETFVVYLPNVVNVYKRQLNPERNSDF